MRCIEIDHIFKLSNSRVYPLRPYRHAGHCVLHKVYDQDVTVESGVLLDTYGSGTLHSAFFCSVVHDSRTAAMRLKAE